MPEVTVETDLVQEYYQDYLDYQREHNEGFVDPNFRDYAAFFTPGYTSGERAEIYLEREGNIHGYYLRDEINTRIRHPNTTIGYYSLQEYDIGETTLNSGFLGDVNVVDLSTIHSMLLHSAVLWSPNLAELSRRWPTLLEQLLDESLYGADKYTGGEELPRSTAAR